MTRQFSARFLTLTCRLKCASEWGFFWRRPSYHSHLEPLHFPILLVFFDLFKPDKRGPQFCNFSKFYFFGFLCIWPHLLVFITDSAGVLYFFHLWKNGCKIKEHLWCIENDRNVPYSASIIYIFFVNKMRIFHPNPTRSLVIVTQSERSKKNGFWSVLFSSLKLSHTVFTKKPP